MIYLIGGAPRIGKSIMAKRVATLMCADFFSTDDIQEKVVGRLTPEEKLRKLPFPGFSGDPAENKLSPDVLVRLQLIEAQSLKPEIDTMVRDAVSAQKDIVVEGVHLLPDHVSHLIKEFGQDRVHGVFMGSEDVEMIAEGIKQNTNPENWLKNSDVEVIRQVAEFSAAYSRYIRAEAARHRLTYFRRTDDFEADKSIVMDKITG